jgi:hypothetical protein
VPFIGFGLMVLGGFFVDCAYKNRPPLQTLIAIVKNPAQYQTTLATSSRGVAATGNPPTGAAATPPNVAAPTKVGGGHPL